jgi:hypothetical protein
VNDEVYISSARKELKDIRMDVLAALCGLIIGIIRTVVVLAAAAALFDLGIFTAYANATVLVVAAVMCCSFWCGLSAWRFMNRAMEHRVTFRAGLREASYLQRFLREAQGELAAQGS